MTSFFTWPTHANSLVKLVGKSRDAMILKSIVSISLFQGKSNDGNEIKIEKNFQFEIGIGTNQPLFILKMIHYNAEVFLENMQSMGIKGKMHQSRIILILNGALLSFHKILL